MWSKLFFISFLLFTAIVSSRSWIICNDGLVYQQYHSFCKDPWYDFNYMRQYSHDVYYQIQVKSFKDSDGDGIGDLNGINEKLGYLKELGVDGAILSPVLRTTANDVDGEVQDFMAIDPSIGTAEDFRNLLEKAAEVGIKIIISFIPNHTSLLHEWFELSANRTEGFTDFYIWKECPLRDGARALPNNWVSVYNTPAWTYHEGRGECYLHQFSPQQPDLNYRNTLIYQKMLDVFEYWIGQGVDGFKLDAINQLFETQSLSDEKYVADSVDTSRHENLVHTHTKNRLESYQFIYDVRDLMDLLAFNGDRKVKVLIVDMADATVSQRALWLGRDEETFGAHVVMNFALTELLPLDDHRNFTINSWQLSRLLENYESRLKPEWTAQNWALGSHEMSRLATAYPIHHEHLAIMTMMLPDTNIFYYGAEIGMTDNLNIQIDGENDFRRVQTPFQWDDTRNAGFSNTLGQTWLPVNTQYVTVNLEAQKNDDESVFKTYQRLIELRKQKEVLRIGKVFVKFLRNAEVISIERRFETYASILTFINFEENPVTMSLWDILPREGYPTKSTAEILFTRKNTSLVSGEPMPNVEESFELGPYAAAIILVNSATNLLTSLFLFVLSLVTLIWL